jgi:putative flippase GtrA
MNPRALWRKYAQFIKFNIVGVLNTGVDFAVFTLLLGVNVPYQAAQCVSYAAGTLNSFLLNKFWTFKDLPEVSASQDPAAAQPAIAHEPAAAQAASALAGAGKSPLQGTAQAGARKPLLQGTARAGARKPLLQGTAQAVRFFILNAVNLGLSLLLLDLFKRKLGLTPLAAKAIVTVFTLLVNYAGSKLWVFRPARGGRGEGGESLPTGGS